MGESVNPLLLTVPRAAEFIGISQSNAWYLIGRGELKSVKVGARRYVPIRDAEEYVERLRQEREVA